MKRRTNPASRRNPSPRIHTDGSSLSDEQLTRLVLDQLNGSSDADGWIMFQVSFFPAMTCARGIDMIRGIESDFLTARGLSVEFNDGQVCLMKCGEAIAGCSPSFYTSPNLPSVVSDLSENERP